MGTEPEALRLAKGLRDGTLLLSERDEAAEVLERLHEQRSADLAAMKMAVEALEAAKFVIDVGMGMGLMRAPKDADGPVVQIPEAIAALRVRVGE